MTKGIFTYEEYEACLQALRNINKWIKDTGTWLPYIEYELKNVEEILEVQREPRTD